MNYFPRFGFALAMLLTITCDSHAATYTNQASFLAAAGPLMFESFEGLMVSNAVGRVQTLVLPHFTITHSGPTTQSFDTLTVFDRSIAGQFATDGTKFVYARTDITSSAIIENIFIHFDHPITAFGFSITDALDTPNGSSVLSIAVDDGDAATIHSGDHPSGNVAFFGLVSTIPFSQAALRNQLVQDGYGLDGFYFSVPVPEPSTWALAVLIAVGLVCSAVAMPSTTGRIMPLSQSKPE